MYVIIHLRKFYRSTCFPRNLKLIHIKVLHYQLYCMAVKLVSRRERGAQVKVFENKVACFGRYLGVIEMKLWENGESCIMLSYMHCIRRLIWLGILNGDDWRSEQSINAYRVLVEKPEGKRPLGRPRRWWENNNKMNLREVGCDPGDWIAPCWRYGPMAVLCKGGKERPISLKAN